MRIVRGPMLVLAALAVTTACGSTQESSPVPASTSPPADAALRRIALTRGASISISVSTAGDSEIEVTVPHGSADAGAYTSRDPALLDLARDAKNSLNEPGVAVAVHVDGSGTVVGFEHTVTR